MRRAVFIVALVVWLACLGVLVAALVQPASAAAPVRYGQVCAVVADRVVCVYVNQNDITARFQAQAWVPGPNPGWRTDTIRLVHAGEVVREAGPTPWNDDHIIDTGWVEPCNGAGQWRAVWRGRVGSSPWTAVQSEPFGVTC